MNNYKIICLLFIASITGLASPIYSGTATSLEDAQAIANTEGKNILIEFYVDD